MNVAASTETALERFRRERPAYASWSYIDRSRTPEDHRKLHEWRGIESLDEWIKIMTMDTGASSPLNLPEEYVAHCKNMYERLGISVNNLAAYDAEDFFFCSLVPKPKVVLDFGAGYGRQAFLFSRLPVTLISMDCIESSYFLQNHVFKQLGFPLWEYLEESGAPRFDRDAFNVVHLPSWKGDLIPENSVDLMMLVFVISEVSDGAREEFLRTLKRTLKVGGHLYIRDNPLAHGWDFEKRLARMGFKPVLFPWKMTEQEFRGTPRIYRYLPGNINRLNTQYVQSFFAPFIRQCYSLKQILVRAKRAIS